MIKCLMMLFIGLSISIVVNSASFSETLQSGNAWEQIYNDLKGDTPPPSSPVKKKIQPQEVNKFVPDIEKEDALTRFIKHFSFSLEEENQAVKGDKRAIKKVRKSLHSLVDQYSEEIHQASIKFDVPESIIAAVIIIESAGKANAKNPKSSATGLMQIINATFNQIKTELINKHNIIVNDRFKPKDNIFAGTYYLSKMFNIANEKKNNQLNRNNVEHWEQALKYYFAGPGYEQLKRKYDPQKGIIMLKYSGGAQIPINAPEKYSNKGLNFARLIKNAQA